MSGALRRAALAAALALCLTACGGSSPGASGASGSAETGAGQASSATSLAPGTYENPVYAKNFPDPGVLRTSDGYLAFGTNGPDGKGPTLSSPDLVHWTTGPDALPALGSWATQGNTWAPEVLKVGATYVLFYVARATAPGVQCIGHATATKPQGPYTDSASDPLVCQSSLGGSIDPNPFRDATGKLWLYWKNDGNCCGKPVHLWAQQLSGDGLSLTGKPVALMSNTQAWEGNLVEAPEMVLHDGHYVLFYSANNYASDKYAIGYATCSGPAGPCVDVSRQPLVHTKGAAAGPGHCFIVTAADGSTWMLYHAWPPDSIGADLPGRELWLDPIQWAADLPTFAGPDAAPQKAPATS
jgi:beta-xylosidase